ncbi:hypothetical protein [Haladaptatus cibarius]|uniref:hypothetical protein n=1 Tax=Haladaptatus cibarius TaxID=453847 RepID=UPI000679377E|nr:hypothetical protein [Haladaptatus cibarius]
MAGTTIPSDSKAIIDSSVLFAMGGPSNGKYQAFERFVRRQNITVIVPEQVAEELGESPGAYEYQRDRLRAAQDAGWLSPGHIDFSVSRVSEVVDTTRTRMAALSADDVTEDEIEKTDTILAGLAYQYVAEGASHVTVFVSDRIAERAITDALAAVDIEDRTSVVEGREFLGKLVE